MHRGGQRPQQAPGPRRQNQHVYSITSITYRALAPPYHNVLGVLKDPVTTPLSPRCTGPSTKLLHRGLVSNSPCAPSPHIPSIPFVWGLGLSTVAHRKSQRKTSCAGCQQEAHRDPPNIPFLLRLVRAHDLTLLHSFSPPLSPADFLPRPTPSLFLLFDLPVSGRR